MLILFGIYRKQKFLRQNLNPNFAKIEISNTSASSKQTGPFQYNFDDLRTN
jgi:hypothetical protein